MAAVTAQRDGLWMGCSEATCPRQGLQLCAGLAWVRQATWGGTREGFTGIGHSSPELERVLLKDVSRESLSEMVPSL